MWKSCCKSETDPAFYLKVEVFEDKKPRIIAPENRFRYKIYVTNYVKLWSAEFDNDGILKIMFDSNKNVETSNGQSFLKSGLTMLNNPKQVDVIEFTESNTGHLNVKLLHKGAIVIQMNFTLSICCAEQFFDIVTRPLLLIIDDQKQSETKLRKLIVGIRDYLRKIPRELLMRYEREDIKEYNDVKHMEDHNMMEQLFGKDSEESIDPKHILNGRPLPASPYYMPLPVKEETDSPDPGPSTMQSSTYAPLEYGIKTEQTDYNLVKSESYNGTSTSNQITSGSKNGTSGSNNGIYKSNISTGSNDSSFLTCVDTNEIINKSSRHDDAVTQSLDILPSKEQDSEHSNDSSTLNVSARRRSNSTEVKPDHRTLNVTPKKRRKNLNY